MRRGRRSRDILSLNNIFTSTNVIADFSSWADSPLIDNRTVLMSGFKVKSTHSRKAKTLSSSIKYKCVADRMYDISSAKTLKGVKRRRNL